MRINKYISATGFCSRREADKLIEDKRVTISGEIAVMGSVVDPSDVVKIDGQPIDVTNTTSEGKIRRKKTVYIAFNKPVGVTCTTESDVPNNIIDFVNHSERIFPIGRLDKDSEGLILLTNDGDIVNKILRAENKHEKEYIVSVNKLITTDFIKGMSKGVQILGQTTKPAKVTRIDERTFKIILTQGLNRQIRRMCEVFGYRVRSLQRIRIMHLRLEGLKLGHWRNLSHKELSQLMEEIE